MRAKEKIVTLYKKQLTTTSEIIAEKCGIEHKAAIQLIRKYIDRFQKRSPLTFEMRKGKKLPQGGFAKSTEYAILNEQQATTLITLFKNTDIVVDFKFTLVDEFTRMKDILSDSNRKDYIQHKRDAHAPMMDALVMIHDIMGIGYPNKSDFICENLLCNMAVTGDWAAAKEADLDSYELKMLKVVRYHNGLLLQHDISLTARIEKLKTYAENYRKKHPHLKLLK